MIPLHPPHSLMIIVHFPLPISLLSVNRFTVRDACSACGNTESHYNYRCVSPQPILIAGGIRITSFIPAISTTCAPSIFNTADILTFPTRRSVVLFETNLNKNRFFKISTHLFQSSLKDVEKRRKRGDCKFFEMLEKLGIGKFLLNRYVILLNDIGEGTDETSILQN